MTDPLSDNSMSVSPKALLRRFNALQEERVTTYQLFEEGFQGYLLGSPNYNFPLYRQLVHEITQTFNNISHDIMCIRDKLNNEHNLNPISTLIDKVQDEEKKKLELTAKHQLCRQNIMDHPDDESYKTEENHIKPSLQEIISNINEYLEEIKYESEEYLADSDTEDIESNNSQEIDNSQAER